MSNVSMNIVGILYNFQLLRYAGENGVAAYGVILKGSLGTSFYLKQTIKLAIPLLGTALAIAPCFKMRFWNIGGEGQITAGAIFASFFRPLLTHIL